MRTKAQYPPIFRMVAATAFLAMAAPAHGAWTAGVAKVDITPREPVPLAGYGGATRMSDRVIHPIWVKALALRDGSGATSVIVTADLVGLSPKMIDVIARRALERHGIAREHLILNCSHNHSCPVTADVLWLYYELTAEEAAARDRYTVALYDRYDEALGNAIAAMEPAELSFGQGLAGFAVNRRRARPGGRGLGGQVDHDVPVLRVRAGGRDKALLFGYSCHTTALSGRAISGDYAGYAQIEMEKNSPGAVAMFVQHCGGDANPLPRISRSDEPAATALAEMYGRILAEAVRQAAAGKMVVVTGPIRAAMGEARLDFQPGPSLAELEAGLERQSGMPRREIEHLIRQFRESGGPPDSVAYPIQVWQLGRELTFIALTGETVVDYSLRFKAAYGWENTWVAGYNNDLLSYVPSSRVLKEGDYEGATGMKEYGHRAPYTDTVEDRIATETDRLVRQVRQDP